jgi:general secretion pathway protein M
MKAWFLALQQRERWVLGAGACIAAAIVLWWAVWSPLRDGTVELRDTVAEKRQLIADLQRAETLTAEGGSSRVRAGQSLLVLIESTAQAAGLAGSFTRTRPDGADAINVSFQNAAFDGLESWLITLEATYGISVERASINEAREEGLVTGQLFLRRI